MCIRRNEKVHQKARLYVSKLNYEKIKGVTQEEKENLVLFQGWLVEGFRNSDSSPPEGQSIHSCWDNILSVSPSLIIRPKLQSDPQVTIRPTDSYTPSS